MVEYITAADLSHTNITDKEEAARLANLYMQRYPLPEFDVAPQGVKDAAIVLAKYHVDLFTDTQTGLLGESVGVGSGAVTESKTYAANAVLKKGWQLQVEAMLAPWLQSRSSFGVTLLARA